MMKKYEQNLKEGLSSIPTLLDKPSLAFAVFIKVII